MTAGEGVGPRAGGPDAAMAEAEGPEGADDADDETGAGWSPI